MKTCTKCGNAKPLSEYSPRKAAPDGLNPRCGDCRREDGREYYRRGGRERANAKYHRDPAASAKRAFDWRQRRRVPKPTPTPEEIRATKERRARLKREANKRTYEKNKAKVLATAARYREAHKAEERAARRAHYLRNREKVARDTKAYREANPGLYAAAGAKRRATERKATVAWANLEKIAEIYEIAARLTRETGVPHEVDHFYPIQGKTVCGLHCEANLQILTMVENRSKANRHPDIPGFDA